MNHYFLSLLVVLLAGCRTVSQPEAFKMPTGERIECQQYEQKECGMTLRDCGPEHSVEFECLRNVDYIGPGSAVPANYAPAAQEDLQ